MTPSEALYWCEQFENNVVKADPQKEKMVLALQAMKQCKEALEKQIPKKPKVAYHAGKFVNYHCANCGEAQGKKVNKRWQKFCPHCGQALDWSDTE